MLRDAEATRTRLLRAAIDEFSAYGLAGGRVDRIASAASANKRAIYDYFGSKSLLFEVAVRTVTDELIMTVRLAPGELQSYAGALFDYLLAHPEARRLLGWRRLERPESAPRLADSFVAELRAGGGRGSEPGSGSGAIGPVDLAILVIGLANAWDLTGPDLVTAAGEDPADPARIAAHRAAVVEAARRIETSS